MVISVFMIHLEDYLTVLILIIINRKLQIIEVYILSSKLRLNWNDLNDVLNSLEI